VVRNGLQPARDVTIRADADTVMQLSNVRIGFAGMPNYLDATGRQVAGRMLKGQLRIQGLVGNLTTLNQVTPVFWVAEKALKHSSHLCLEVKDLDAAIQL